MKKVGGIISLKVNGIIFNAKGAFTWSKGAPTRETVIGVDGIHGFKDQITVPNIEGSITDTDGLNLDDLENFVDETVTLELPSGKLFSLYNAFFTNPDGLSGNTEEGEIQVRFEGQRAEIT